MDIREVVRTLVGDGFLLVFNEDRLDVVRTAEALISAGLNNMEVTCRIRRPLEEISRLRRELPDFVVGAASLIDSPGLLEVCNSGRPGDPLPTLEQAVDAGARYLVSAVSFSEATFERFAGKVALIPGCGSATEVVSQFSRGANLVKVFPARQMGGPAFVKAVDPALHRTISLVPTGGTSAENIPDYVRAGVLVVGGSFSAIEKTTWKRILDTRDYGLLAAELTAVKRLIDRLRAERYPGLDFAGASLEEIGRATGRSFNLDARAVPRPEAR